MEISNVEGVEGVVNILHNGKSLQLRSPEELDLFRKFSVSPAKLQIDVWKAIFPESRRKKGNSYDADHEALTEIQKDAHLLPEAFAHYDANRNTHDGSCDADIEQ